MNLIGWFADYPDPYDFVNVLLYGKTIAKLEQRQHGVLRRPRRSTGGWSARR